MNSGEVAANWCSRAEATAWNATRWEPARRRASPRPAARSMRASPPVRAKVSAIRSMAWGAWRIRIWVAAFAGGFGQAVQEFGAFAVAEQGPGFVDHDKPPDLRSGSTRLAAGVNVSPDAVEGEEHAGGAQFVGELPGRPHHQVAAGVE